MIFEHVVSTVVVYGSCLACIMMVVVAISRKLTL